MFGRNAEQIFLADMFQISLLMGGLCIPEAGLSVRASIENTERESDRETESERERETERERERNKERERDRQTPHLFLEFANAATRLIKCGRRIARRDDGERLVMRNGRLRRQRRR